MIPFFLCLWGIIASFVVIGYRYQFSMVCNYIFWIIFVNFTTMQRDFDGGHVEGAINIPVDANDAVRRQAIKDMSRGNSLVVYCQSVNCSFADVVAGKLRLDGFSTVSILPGGWMEWTTGTRPRMPNQNSQSGKWRLNKDGTASPI